jgi:hypothetical protein
MKQLCKNIECRDLSANFSSEFFDILNFVYYAPRCQNAAPVIESTYFISEYSILNIARKIIYMLKFGSI